MASAVINVAQQLFRDYRQLSKRLARGSFWLAFMPLLIMLCPNTIFLTPPRSPGHQALA